MLIPKYLFTDDFSQFHDYLSSKNFLRKTIKAGELLCKFNDPIKTIYYIESGLAQTSVNHENGNQKILSYHCKGTIFPLPQKSSFKIEKSIITKAVSDMEVLCFDKDDFFLMYAENKDFNEQVLEWKSSYINLLIYDTAHQDYNNSFTKICNFLYLFSYHSISCCSDRITLTQDTIADILAINRVNVTNNLAKLRKEGIIKTHRNWIEIVDCPKLVSYCSMETLCE